MPKVHVIGGGVAGLTAAHELAERGFDVTVYERNAIAGGKARSMDNLASPGPQPGKWPGEHGFRFFPGFYAHLNDTMRRIPVGLKTALDNLVEARQIGIALRNKPLFEVQSATPTTLQEWIRALKDIFASPSLGLSQADSLFFIKRLICFLGSGPTRRRQQYESQSWWDFIDAGPRSDAYKNILARGLTRSLVAMKAEDASAYTIGRMLVQILEDILDLHEEADRVLNAPTNMAWIDPWVTHLRNIGDPSAVPPRSDVTFRMDTEAKDILLNSAGTKIDHIVISHQGGPLATVGADTDHYVLAIPVDVVQADIPSAVKIAAGITPAVPNTGPDVGLLPTDWMNGILFYVNRDVSESHGHVIYAESAWALTSISQGQFWPGYPWSTQGTGKAVDIISVDISAWDIAGTETTSKTAKACTRQEIVDEVWAQLVVHRNKWTSGALQPVDLEGLPFIDPAIQFDSSEKVTGNREPLLVNKVNTLRHRPPAATNLSNLVLASDYVATNTDLACMESANEAARQAVNAILDRESWVGPRCLITPLEEPKVFTAFQQLDEVEFAANSANPPLLCRLADSLVLPGGATATPLSVKLAWVFGIASAILALLLVALS